MWTLAASTSGFHLTLRDSLYRRTRRALEGLDGRSNATDTDVVEAELVQAWLLLAVHELTSVGFRRAWISAGRAFRLLQLTPSWTTAIWTAADNDAPPQKTHGDWVEAEERRRTFWFAYCLDRLISLRNGSPPTFSERVYETVFITSLHGLSC